MLKLSIFSSIFAQRLFAFASLNSASDALTEGPSKLDGNIDGAMLRLVMSWLSGGSEDADNTLSNMAVNERNTRKSIVG